MLIKLFRLASVSAFPGITDQSLRRRYGVERVHISEIVARADDSSQFLTSDCSAPAMRKPLLAFGSHARAE